MLKKVDNIDFSKLHTFEEVTAAASSSEMVHQLEEVLMVWYKQIEQVGPLPFPLGWSLVGPSYDILSLMVGGSCKAIINILYILINAGN